MKVKWTNPQPPSVHTHAAAKQVVTFGWNEHGMCATGDETNVYHPHTVDSLRDWEPALVGAGAGHSFVVAKLARR